MKKGQMVQIGEPIQHRTDVVRYFLDTEFYEDGSTIDLISIGVVCSDGRELYAINQDARLDRVSPWLRANVLPHLPPYTSDLWIPRSKIRDLLADFVWNGGLDPDAKNEFWAYYADYDWIAVCQVFGTMMDLPKNFPMHCMDVKQYAVMVGNPELPTQALGTVHDALEDARQCARMYRFLREYKAP
jgi:3' exoribonuclease, RNase T-like